MWNVTTVCGYYTLTICHDVVINKKQDEEKNNVTEYIFCYLFQVAVRVKNAHPSNFSVEKNLPKIQMVENASPNDGNVITIEIAKMERTKSIVVSLQFNMSQVL